MTVSVSFEECKQHIAKYISTTRANALLPQLQYDFNHIIESLYNKLQTMKYDKLAMNMYRRRNHPLSCNMLLQDIGIDLEVYQQHARKHPHKKESLDSYILLAGILIVKLANGLQWKNKYFSVEEFLSVYERVVEISMHHDNHTEEMQNLMRFANALHDTLQYLSSNGCKQKLISIASCLSEGPEHCMYVSGGTQILSNTNRVTIYHVETNTPLTIRPRRRGDVDAFSEGDIQTIETQFNIQTIETQFNMG